MRPSGRKGDEFAEIPQPEESPTVVITIIAKNPRSEPNTKMIVTSRIVCEPGRESLDVSSRPMKKRSGNCEGKQANIAVVDDDQSIRESLPDLLKMLGFTAQAFASPEEFLASDFFHETDCLILDVAMKGMSGPQLQTKLKGLGSKVPIIFITAQSNWSLRQRLVEQGAVTCLLKPFSDTALREALNRALHLS